MSGGISARTLRSTATLSWTQLKLLLRDMGAVFWSFVFPVVMVVIFGEAYGNRPRPELGGLGYMDTFVPGLIAISISSAAFYQAGAALVDLRERQVLRRLKTSPLPPWTVVTSQILPAYAMILLTSLAVWLTGWWLYGVEVQGRVLAVFGALTLGALGFLALAFVMASLVRTAGAANAVSSGLNMLMMVFSGAIIPISVMSEQFQKISAFVPLTYVVNLLRAAFVGTPASEVMTSVWVVIGCFVAGVLISSRTFRWE